MSDEKKLRFADIFPPRPERAEHQRLQAERDALLAERDELRKQNEVLNAAMDEAARINAEWRDKWEEMADTYRRSLRCLTCDWTATAETTEAVEGLLKAHVAVCPGHPMRTLEAESVSLRSRLETAERERDEAKEVARANGNEALRQRSEVRRAVEEAAKLIEQRANRAFLPTEPMDAIRRELLGAAAAIRARSSSPAPAVEIPPTDANGSPLPCACPPGHVNDCPNRAP